MESEKNTEIIPETRSIATDLPKRMKAIPFTTKLENPQGLHIQDWDTPTIQQPNDVIIRVKAFGLNFADISARKGQYMDAPKGPFVPGYEVSGIVVSVGSSVTTCKVGDKVIGGCFLFGGYAEYVKTFQEAVVPLPEGWTFAQGASILVVFLTAYHSLTQTGPLNEGDRVLIHAAAGGVGLAAVQIAKHCKCEIYGTCGSEDKMKLLREKGVQYPINYRTTDFETEIKKLTNGEGVDIVIDSIGGSYLKKDLNIIRPCGRVIGMGAASFIDRSLGNLLSVVGGVISMSTLSSIDLMVNSKSFIGVNLKAIADRRRPVLQRELSQLMKLFEDKTFLPDIITEFPWDQIVKAHTLLEGRKTTGKLVMIVP